MLEYRRCEQQSAGDSAWTAAAQTTPVRGKKGGSAAWSPHSAQPQRHPTRSSTQCQFSRRDGDSDCFTPGVNAGFPQGNGGSTRHCAPHAAIAARSRLGDDSLALKKSLDTINRDRVNQCQRYQSCWSEERGAQPTGEGVTPCCPPAAKSRAVTTMLRLADRDREWIESEEALTRNAATPILSLRWAILGSILLVRSTRSTIAVRFDAAANPMLPATPDSVRPRSDSDSFSLSLFFPNGSCASAVARGHRAVDARLNHSKRSYVLTVNVLCDFNLIFFLRR